MMNPFETAWLLLKAPFMDTDVPNVRMAYNREEGEPVIGSQPYMSRGATIEHMTPDEYFDYLQDASIGWGGVHVGGRDDPYRWDRMMINPYGGSRENIARIQEGIGQGIAIGMPSLMFRNNALGDGRDMVVEQDGGHRMEALRQMGHGGTKVPVMVYRPQNMSQVPPPGFERRFE